jgi:gliding motility-associated-like protein
VSSTESLSYEACPGDGITFDGTFVPVGGTQAFNYTNVGGCDSTITVTVNAFPIVTSQLALQTCPGTTIVYEGVALAPGDQQDFLLTDQNGCDSIVQVSVASLPTHAEMLQLTACQNSFATYQGVQLYPGDVQDFPFTNQFGCDSVVSVTVLALPADTLALSLQVCEGGTMDFNGQQLAAGDAQSFIFQNQFGCDSVVQVSVSSYPSVAYDLVAGKICWNSSSGSIEVQNVSGSTGPFLFSLDGLSYQPDPLFEGLPGGSYAVFVQDANDCVFEGQIDIPTVPPIFVEAMDETLTCGDSVQLSPLAVSELPLAWLWQDGNVQDKIWAKSPGTYSFQVSNDCETVERSLTVRLDESGPAPLLYMPNSFSPNGDLINDCYQGFLSPRLDLQFFVLKIFDRWGNMMFQTNDPASCWDGNRKGKALDPAVFVWFVEMHIRDCEGAVLEIFREGDLHLLR